MKRLSTLLPGKLRTLINHFTPVTSQTRRRLTPPGVRRLSLEALESRVVLSTVPLSELPILHSAPQYSTKIYLDFDGEITPNGLPFFRTLHDSPYSLDVNLFSFTEEELESMYEIWRAVAEDFAPFQVDVTTENPGSAYFQEPTDNVHVIYSDGTDSIELGGTGEVLLNGGVSGGTESPIVRVSDNTSDLASVASHEIGHALGVGHDGTTSPGNSYYGGHTGWSPLMGQPDNSLTQWSNGGYYESGNQQNDLAIMAARVGYRVDDHSSVISLASSPTQLSQNGEYVSGAGIITQSGIGSGSTNNDIDVFKFTTGSGQSRVIIDVLPQDIAPNLDIQAKIYDSQGVVKAEYDLSSTLSAHLDVTLAAGTHMLVIDGVGWGDPFSSTPTGYTEYGSLGNYTIGGRVELVGDYNHDNTVNSLDYDVWAASATTGLYADGDRNGVVNGNDFLVWQAAVGATATPPQTLLVSTLSDEQDGIYAAGDLSLREALLRAAAISGANTIAFDPAIFPAGVTKTISLSYDGPDSGNTADQLLIDSNVTIEGTGVEFLKIDGHDATRVFQVNSGTTSTIRGLTIRQGNAVSGGNLYNLGTLTLDKVTIEDGNAQDGAGIHNSGTLTLTKSTIKSNHANYGGGVFNAGILTSTDTTLTANFAAIAGGGLYHSYGTSNLTSNTIDTNSAYQGGGIYVTGGTFNLKNATVSTNQSLSDGGGIAVLGDLAYVTIYHSTIAFNSSANGDGGGLMIGEDQYYNAIGHTIIADNSASGSDNIGGIVGWGGGNYNLLGAQGTGGLLHGTGGNIVLGVGVAAGLAPLRKYGGQTRTHALRDTSPAIETGISSAVAGSGGIPLYDQRGISRVLDGNGNSVARIDIGAVEWSKPLLQVDDLAGHDDGNYGTGNFSLHEALELAAQISGTDVITVAPSLTGVLPLDNALVVSSNVEIVGTGTDLLIIRGQNLPGIGGEGFVIQSGVTATIRGLTVRGATGMGIRSHGTLTLDQVTIDKNTGSYGGGLYHDGGGLVISNSTFTNNTSLNSGGAIRLGLSAWTYIVNSTFSGNSAASVGGGIYADTELVIDSSTITANNATSGGGGIYDNGVYGTVQLFNSIVAGNLSGGASNDVVGDFGGSSSYNLIGNIGDSLNLQSTLHGTSSQPLNARLAPLANYGGTTKTHALLDDSPAIDAGNPAAVPGGAFDQRGSGNPRVVDGNGDSSARIDIGAYEKNRPLLRVETLDDELDGEFGAGISLREALTLANLSGGQHVITFAANVVGTVELDPALGVLPIAANIEVAGPGADALAIDGQGATRIFDIGANGTGTLHGLTIANSGVSEAIVSFGTLKVDESFITNSTGLGIKHLNGAFELRNSTVAYTGGIELGEGTELALIVNSTISHNTAVNGGGINILAKFVPFQIINSTITANHANSGAGGIHVAEGRPGTPPAAGIVRNSIIAGNTSGGLYDDVFGTFAASSYNLIGIIDGSTGLNASTSYYGTSSNALDAGLTELGDHGGTVPTHALLEGSLAIDGGDDNVADLYDLLYDQRGENRFADGDGTSGPRVDIGAFELRADEYFGSL